MYAMPVPVDQERRTPGRPRSARAERAIVDAVLALLSEGMAVEALSVEAVAARAGVGKATIYRRWPRKHAMVVDAIATLKLPPPEPTGESVRDDLVALLRSVCVPKDQLAERILYCLGPALRRDGEFFQAYQAILEPRRQAMRAVLRRGIRHGELREDLDVEVAVAALGGAVALQRMMRWNPALDTEDLPERLVDLVLAGARVADPGPAARPVR